MSDVETWSDDRILEKIFCCTCYAEYLYWKLDPSFSIFKKYLIEGEKM